MYRDTKSYRRTYIITSDGLTALRPLSTNRNTTIEYTVIELSQQRNRAANHRNTVEPLPLTKIDTVAESLTMLPIVSVQGATFGMGGGRPKHRNHRNVEAMNCVLFVERLPTRVYFRLKFLVVYYLHGHRTGSYNV